MGLAGKIALVTGGGSGIGRSTSKVLSERGLKIIVADVDRKLGEETMKSIQQSGGEAFFVRIDVSDPNEVKSAITAGVEKFGGLNVLVNNAGIAMKYGPITDVPETAWDETIDVNLKGVFLCSKFAIPEIKRNGRGSIINIASVDGLYGLPEATPYCASKGGVIALTKAMALDCAPLGIRVNCICPGAVMTPLQERFYNQQNNPLRLKQLYDKGYPMGRIGRPEEIGYLVSYLASDESEFVTGSVFIIDGGMHAQYGEAILDKIAKGSF